MEKQVPRNDGRYLTEQWNHGRSETHPLVVLVWFRHVVVRNFLLILIMIDGLEFNHFSLYLFVSSVDYGSYYLNWTRFMNQLLQLIFDERTPGLFFGSFRSFSNNDISVAPCSRLRKKQPLLVPSRQFKSCSICWEENTYAQSLSATLGL